MLRRTYKALSIAVATAMTAALVAVGSLVAAPPASAHTAEINIYRQSHSCLYKGGSSHTKAWTKKVRGLCQGHAWLYVQTWQGWRSGWKHYSGRVTVYAPHRQYIRYSWHKSQRNESARQIAH